MPLAVREYLQHILDEAAYITRNSNGLTKEGFLADETLQRAFVRAIEIIGEAVKHIPEQTRMDYPAIEMAADSWNARPLNPRLFRSG